MQTLYEKMGGTYSANKDGIYYPDLEVAEETEPHYGKYGMMRKAFLKEHQSGRYMSLLFPRATSQAAVLARLFGDCREGQISCSLLQGI